MRLSREQVREVDRRAIEEFGVPGVVLMENAGRGAAELLVALGVSGSVAICCYKGNNGGDGFVIARHLDLLGVAIRVHLFCEPDELAGDAAINHRIVERAGLPLVAPSSVSLLADDLRRAEWVVDALFGTGLRGPILPPLADVVEAINASGLKVLAVDIPSGLDCDQGIPLGPTVRASHTATFIAEKTGFAVAAAREWLGLVHVLGIGAPRAALGKTR